MLAITTDNATNNNVLFRTIQKEFDHAGLNHPPIQHVRCMAHIINLAVQAFLTCLKADDDEDTVDITEGGEISKLRMIITKIRSSLHRQDEFKKNCKIFGLNSKELILDVKTRWNSTYSMIERAVEFQDVSLLFIFQNSIQNSI